MLCSNRSVASVRYGKLPSEISTRNIRVVNTNTSIGTHRHRVLLDRRSRRSVQQSQAITAECSSLEVLRHKEGNNSAMRCIAERFGCMSNAEWLPHSLCIE